MTASTAMASGPTSLGASGWQIYASTAQYPNPDSAQIHGDPGEYAGAPAIPGENDPGWVNCGPSAPTRFGRNMCPNANTIGMQVTSVLSGCWANLNFTFFQALVSIPSGTTISQFSVNMSGADDGARISLVNSAYPNGVTPNPGGYIYQLTGQATGNLASYVVAGEVNRVIITQVDDCASGNNLNSAQVLLNGAVIVPDTTAPTDAPVVAPAANANGWNNSDVSVNWNWTDSGSNASGVDPNNCPQSSTSSGEGTQTLSSTCYDLAGNHRSDSRTVKVDKTAPTDAPSVSTSGSTATVTWNWSDGLSGIDPANCTQTSSKSGGGLVTISATCADLAGNSKTDSVQVQLDNTPPTDAPSVVPAWSNSDVTVNWNWTDSGSGIDPNNCQQSTTSSGEGTLTVSSTCADLAGNSATDSVTVHVDKTAPTASPDVPSGWHSSDQTVIWNWSDAGSGIDPSKCTQSSVSSGEGAAVTVTATCTDLAGNTGTASATVQVDKTAPTATPDVPSGWHNSDQTVTWNWSDSGSGIDPAHCTQSSVSSGEGAAVTVTATCTDNVGNTGSASATVMVDKTAPVAAPSTPPAWSNSDVTVNWNWSDGGSGIDPSNCTQSSTSSGEGAITLTATCTDLAGNTGTASQVVHVDKTAPTLNPSVSPNPVGLNNAATASPHATDGGSGIASASCTQPNTSALGTFTVTCTATDKAGNTATATASYDVTGQATKQALLAQMKAALGSSNKHDNEGLRDAITALAASLDPSLWTDPNHPASKRVFEDEQHCVDQLSELLHDKHSSISAATVQGWINALVGEDRALAALAIADATAAGGDAHQLAQASKELAQGDSEAARGRGNAAIEHYGNAWQQATQSGGHGDGGGDGKGHDH